MTSDTKEKILFDNPAFDPDRFAADMSRVGAPRCFGIIFTPRSGSSWLTDILEKSKFLGRPREWFNPNFVPRISQAVNARSLDSYIKMLRRKHKVGGYFSFEITIYQMQRVFGGPDRFLTYFPAETPFYYLTREDIVLQAISLAKTAQTEVFHSAHSSTEDIARADSAYRYDGKEISHWLDHLFDQERKCERFFAQKAITPRRLVYEDITAAGAAETTRRILRDLKHGHRAAQVVDLESDHRKIGSDRNTEFAERFRREHPALIDDIEAVRQTWPRVRDAG